ncbi:MAG: TetR/AcrR family transcriptional regulator [Marmoricola sp.]|nr:TetR/AcrR family transcriptional regulator [Marmoricola sp.]
MPRDSSATRQRLLVAALAEFAELGIAGARVDRIAKVASANKAQIYHYFGSKEALFEAAFEMIVQMTVSEAPISVDDLPAYAATLAKGYDDHPEIARLATWARLERAGSPPIQMAVEATAAKVAAIARAQQDGRVSDRFPPDVTLGLILTIATMWSAANPEYLASVEPRSREDRHRYVAEAVRVLLSPDSGAS